MKKRLSSIIFTIFKFIPVLLIADGIFWLFYDFYNVKLSGILGLLFMSAIFYLLTFRWKSVSVKGDTLQVFNYLKSINIPVSNIASIEVSSWWTSAPRTIILKLKSSSQFGDEIIFVPKPLGYMATDTANELRRFLISKD